MAGDKKAAYSSIKEVSKDLDLPSHVLRFWETKFKDIKPVKRSGGCRYYRPEDIALIKRIKHLLYDEKYTIKGALAILKEQKVLKTPDVDIVTPTPSAPAASSLNTDLLSKLKDVREALKSALN